MDNKNILHRETQQRSIKAKKLNPNQYLVFFHPEFRLQFCAQILRKIINAVMKPQKQNENALLTDVFVQKTKKTQFIAHPIRLKSQRLQN